MGKRNYRFFYTFIVSLSFLTAFVFGCVATHLALSRCERPGRIRAPGPVTLPRLLLQGLREEEEWCLLCRRVPADILQRQRGRPRLTGGCSFFSMCSLTAASTALELVICFLSVWSILGLSGFHTYLLASNLTTDEDVRRRFFRLGRMWVRGCRITRSFLSQMKGSWSGRSGEGATNPYSHRNVFMNCCSTLCAPMPPRLVPAHP